MNGGKNAGEGGCPLASCVATACFACKCVQQSLKCLLRSVAQALVPLNGQSEAQKRRSKLDLS